MKKAWEMEYDTMQNAKAGGSVHRGARLAVFE